MKNYLYISILAVLFVSPLFAGEADVIEVQVTKNNDDTYNFEVTVSHADTGWHHYANKWEILDENDSILATRVLLHPHENEQPFTRGLSNIEIPSDIKQIKVRAHDSVHGYGEKIIKMNLH